eukprot:g1427.t1
MFGYEPVWRKGATNRRFGGTYGRRKVWKVKQKKASSTTDKKIPVSKQWASFAAGGTNALYRIGIAVVYARRWKRKQRFIKRKKTSLSAASRSYVSESQQIARTSLSSSSPNSSSFHAGEKMVTQRRMYENRSNFRQQYNQQMVSHRPPLYDQYYQPQQYLHRREYLYPRHQPQQQQQRQLEYLDTSSGWNLEEARQQRIDMDNRKYDRQQRSSYCRPYQENAVAYHSNQYPTHEGQGTGIQGLQQQHSSHYFSRGRTIQVPPSSPPIGHSHLQSRRTQEEEKEQKQKQQQNRPVENTEVRSLYQGLNRSQVSNTNPANASASASIKNDITRIMNRFEFGSFEELEKQETPHFSLFKNDEGRMRKTSRFSFATMDNDAEKEEGKPILNNSEHQRKGKAKEERGTNALVGNVLDSTGNRRGEALPLSDESLSPHVSSYLSPWSS